MKNRLWAVTAVIILLNFALVLFLRKSLPEVLPSHIGLDGSYATTMPYTKLFFYPAVSLVLATGIYLLAALLFKTVKRLDNPIRCAYIDIIVLCFALIILCSTCVSLTMGKVHFFMFAEPAIFLLMLAAIVIGEIRIRKNQ